MDTDKNNVNGADPIEADKQPDQTLQNQNQDQNSQSTNDQGNQAGQDDNSSQSTPNENNQDPNADVHQWAKEHNVEGYNAEDPNWVTVAKRMRGAKDKADKQAEAIKSKDELLSGSNQPDQSVAANQQQAQSSQQPAQNQQQNVQSASQITGMPASDPMTQAMQQQINQLGNAFNLNNFVRDHPDYVDFKDEMKQIQAEKPHLRNDFETVLALAKQRKGVLPNVEQTEQQQGVNLQNQTMAQQPSPHATTPVYTGNQPATSMHGISTYKQLDAMTDLTQKREIMQAIEDKKVNLA